MIEQAVVDGVSVLLAAGSEPVRGGVTFRVGPADESLARLGITHLVEHLVMNRLGVTDYHWHGNTARALTYFWWEGSADEVADFLSAVGAALSDLPLDQLEQEKRVLRDEARHQHPASPMLQRRYGARTYGLDAWPEYGLGELTAEGIQAWVSRYFTRDNAVLWITTSHVPARLRLNLPSGVRMPAPTAVDTIARTPAWSPGPPAEVSLHSTVRPGAAAQVYADVLRRELERALWAQDLTVDPETDYEPLDTETAMVLAFAPVHAGQRRATLDALAGTLRKLAAGELAQRDIDEIVEEIHEAHFDELVDPQRLPVAAANLLKGMPVRSVAEELVEYDEVTLDAVCGVARQAHAGSLLMAPESAHDLGYVRATRNQVQIVGESFRSVADPETALVVGDDGVSLIQGPTVSTVLFTECAALLAWPDGSRMVIGNDGVACGVRPTLYALGIDAVARLDAAVPPDRTVRMPK